MVGTMEASEASEAIVDMEHMELGMGDTDTIITELTDQITTETMVIIKQQNNINLKLNTK